MVDEKVHDDPHAQPVGLVNERLYLFQRAVRRIELVVLRQIVVDIDLRAILMRRYLDYIYSK